MRHKRTQRAKPKHASNDSELRRNDQIEAIQTPVLSGFPGRNQNGFITGNIYLSGYYRIILQ
jgi:hypothetical protein